MSSIALILHLLGLCCALILSMAFYALESATLTLNRMRLLDLFGDGSSGSLSEQEILKDTKDIYFVSRLGLCAMFALAGILSLGLFAEGVERLLGGDVSLFVRQVLSLVTTLIVLPPVFIFFVFALPRLMAVRSAEPGEARLPRWLGVFLVAVRPLAVFRHLPDALRLGSFLPRRELTKSDLLALVTDLEADEDGVPDDPDDPDEEEIIYNILDLEETWVREVMRPINEVVAIRLGEKVSIEHLRRLSLSTGYSRFPVYRNRIVNLVGYVSVYDILYSDTDNEDLESFVVPPFYVPEFMLVSDILREFRKRGVHVAVVVDEYGGSSGWITREDVLEEIVGEIEDEFEARRRMVVSCSPGQWLVDGKMDIDDLADELPVHFEDPVYDTLAGFMLMSFGFIPRVGDTWKTNEAVFRVEQMEGNRIAQVRIALRSQ